MSAIEIKALSSLEKCFLDEGLENKNELTGITVFSNQRLCYQIALCRSERLPHKQNCRISLEGKLAKYASLRRVVSVPVHFPCRTTTCDNNYLRKTPGLYPDLLQPMQYGDQIALLTDQPEALWIEAHLPSDIEAGSYPLTLRVTDLAKSSVLAEKTVTVRVLGEKLPEQKLIHTEWFYTDCIANHYRVRAFGEKHWKLIESFLRTAAENGINMILTPIFTPALDTRVGGERLTTQLLDIHVTGKDQYSFGFALLDRWIELCHSLGIRYFEFAHFFTQWGAKHAPKIVATVGGRKKRIFGWDTDACGEEYAAFLRQMLNALTDHLEEKGILGNCYFHVSDEPSLNALEQYDRCKNMIEPYLKGAPIIDALSEYDFYETGAIQKPVPGIRSIDPFLAHKVQGLWAYYCGDSGNNVSGRMMAMPLARTRILGIQLWLHNIEGFLHWGFNFYNNQYSNTPIDPFLYSDGEYFAPSGDMYLVYPGTKGEAWESMRLNAMREAMEDMRLLDLCETRIGRENTIHIIEKTAGQKVTFTSYPTSASFILELRDTLIAAIEASH